MSGSSSSQASRSSNTSSSIGFGGDNDGQVIDGNGNTVSTTDYGGVEIDNTQDNSINGEYAGNTGTINVVDGGAFELVNEANNTVAGMASESLELANSLGGGAFGLASEVGDLSAHMLGTSLDASTAALSDAAQLIDGQAQHNLDAAIGITEASVYMLDSNNNFAMNLAAQNGETLRVQNADNNSALGNGFKSMMQFADNVSRSDGANLAKSTNKTMMVVAVAGAVAFVVFNVWGKK